MLRNIKIYYVLLVVIVSCQHDTKKNITTTYKKQVSREDLIIPKDLDLYYHPKHLTVLDSASIANAERKLYISLDASCASCFDKVNFWSSQEDLLRNHHILPIIILRSKDKFRLFEFLCKKDKIYASSIPFFFDKKIAFEAANEIGDAQIYTNRNNKVIQKLIISKEEELNEFLTTIK